MEIRFALTIVYVTTAWSAEGKEGVSMDVGDMCVGIAAAVGFVNTTSNERDVSHVAAGHFVSMSAYEHNVRNVTRQEFASGAECVITHKLKMATTRVPDAVVITR